MSRIQRPLVWLHGEVKSPPFSAAARLEAGLLLRQLQLRCHELRLQDQKAAWRIVYRLDPDAVVVVEVFSKNTRTTPRLVIQNCRRRLRLYDALAGDTGEDH